MGFASSLVGLQKPVLELVFESSVLVTTVLLQDLSNYEARSACELAIYTFKALYV